MRTVLVARWNKIRVPPIDFFNREIRRPREQKRRERDIFVERDKPKAASSVSSGIFRPTGLGDLLRGGSTKMSPLAGLKLARGKPLTHHTDLLRRKAMKAEAIGIFSRRRTRG